MSIYRVKNNLRNAIEHLNSIFYLGVNTENGIIISSKETPPC